MTSLSTLEERIGYTFENRSYLEQALTHSSYANEVLSHSGQGALLCNERMEFLGDSVLSLVTTRYLYETIRNKPEGVLTKLRAQVVCESALVKIAEDLGLGEFLYLGRGEERTGGRERHSILADATEALFAAIFLDGGLEKAAPLILRYIPELVETARKGVLFTDYKTKLQELVQKSKEEIVTYQQDGEEGPDHRKSFHVTLYINSNPFAEGIGHSKKEAEQAAAQAALRLMGVEE